VYRSTVLTPAEAGLRRAAFPVSPVLRLGLPYFARVAGLRRREGIASPVPNCEGPGAPSVESSVPEVVATRRRTLVDEVAPILNR